jgi:hypothetical protein
MTRHHTTATLNYRTVVAWILTIPALWTQWSNGMSSAPPKEAGVESREEVYEETIAHNR